MHLAAKSGHAHVCRVLAQAGADLETSAFGGRRALHLAASFGNMDAVETLIKFGAHKDALDHDKSTPLAFACHMGHEHIVEMLMQAGADPNITSAKPIWTPLHLAVKESTYICT